ncbi:MAG: hypothetical protein OEQ53_17815, partial [Saprospiraceae bacterium]|nr:hypothetical protein [Saprospiraceae bacterium]
MKISQVIGLISTCFLLILGGQVYWLKHSHDIIENQFDQKVSMALCSAVSEVGNCTNESCTLKDEGYLANTSNGLAFSTDCLQMQAIDKGRLNPAIARALDFYDLPPTFEIDLVQACDLDCDPTSPYCCAVGSYDAG